jgi:hypothetical protein
VSATFSNVSQNDPKLAEELTKLHEDLIRAGAKAAAERLNQAAENANDLEAQGIFRAIDPARTVSEIEAVQGRNAARLTAVRNVLALLPLLLTWFSLALASAQYSSYVARHINDPNPSKTVNLPFLSVWQSGFDGQTPLTFSATAIADFFLLFLVVLVTVMAHTAEGAALRKARRLGERVDAVTERLVIAAVQGSLRMPTNADPAQWVEAIRKVVDKAMQQSANLAASNQQVVKEASLVLQGIRADTEHLIRQEMAPLVNQFQTNLHDLQQELDRYHQSAADLVNTVQ